VIVSENARRKSPNPPSNLGVKTEIVGYLAFLITSKGLDVRRQGATTEAYRAIRWNERRDRRQRRPSALLRAMSPSTLLRTVSLSNGLSNGR